MTDPTVQLRAQAAASTFKRLGITQEELAASLGLSQSQVSRILSGRGVRASKLFEEVCSYAEKVAAGGVTREAVVQNGELVDALTVTWDGTASHAKALAAVIRTLAVLHPASAGLKGAME